MRLFVKTVGSAPKSMGDGVMEVEILSMPPQDTTGLVPEKKALFASAGGIQVSVQTMPDIGEREDLDYHVHLRDVLAPYRKAGDTVILGGIEMARNREIIPFSLALEMIDPDGYNVMNLDFADPKGGSHWDAMAAMMGTDKYYDPDTASLAPRFAADTIRLAQLLLEGTCEEDAPGIYATGTPLLLASVMMKVWGMAEATEQELAGCFDVRRNCFEDVCDVLYTVKDAAALDKFMDQGKYFSSANGAAVRTYFGLRRASTNLFNNIFTNLIMSISDLYLTHYAYMMSPKKDDTLDINKLSRKKNVVAVHYASAAERVHAEKIFFQQAVMQALKYPGNHNVRILLRENDPMWDVLAKMPCFSQS